MFFCIDVVSEEISTASGSTEIVHSILNHRRIPEFACESNVAYQAFAILISSDFRLSQNLRCLHSNAETKQSYLSQNPYCIREAAELIRHQGVR